MGLISDVLLGVAISCMAIATLTGSFLIVMKSWGRPGESADVIWASDLPPAERRLMAQLDAAPVEVIRLPPAPAPVEHVEATEEAPPAGAIGTVAPDVSPDLEWWLTAQEQAIAACWDQAHADHDLWLLREAVDQALADYETRMLTRRTWSLASAAPEAYESTQQRIDRWLEEGGMLATVTLADVRRVASDTWDAPSAEWGIVERPDAEATVEALLAS